MPLYNLNPNPNASVHLVIDIGNTLCKAAIFNGDRLEELWTGTGADEQAIDALVSKYHPVAAMVSTVRRDDHIRPLTDDHDDRHMPQDPAPRQLAVKDDMPVPARLTWLKGYGFPVLVAGPHLQMPITIRYRTPETLGSDRLAAAVAAHHLFPKENVLVINAGTCLTTDFVNDKGEYLGGTIAPGLQMRLQALHQFTGNLPLVNVPTETTNPRNVTTKTRIPKSPNFPTIPMPGQSTRDAILAGVVHGLTSEINGMTERWKEKIRFFNVILSGGDGKMFDKKLKNRIFAVENIVLRGLNQMLKHNA